MATFKELTCPNCDVVFTPTGPAAKFCSVRCRSEAKYGVLACVQCGEEFIPFDASGQVRPATFCSRRCWYDWRAAQVPSRRVHPTGYVMLRVPKGTPGTQGDRLWMLEHRFVMQESLGRPLLPTETVHHINGDKADNRLENLQLRRGRHGKGVKLVCLDCGSHNVAHAHI